MVLIPIPQHTGKIRREVAVQHGDGTLRGYEVATLHNRYELSDGLTNEERAVKNCTVTQLFEPEPPTALECAKINAQHKLAPKAKRKVLLQSYAGGVINVYREDNETYVDTLHEDMDTETLPFARFLERHAFK